MPKQNFSPFHSRLTIVLAGLVAMAVMTGTAALAQTLTTIHHSGSNEKSTVPIIFFRGLLADSNGNLFSTTYLGGTFSAGTVFELSPPASGGAWTETVLYNFAGGTDGGGPGGKLVADASGNLYGATYSGGLGYGAIFQLTPPSIAGGAWTENVLYRFQGTDGHYPGSGLILDKSGNLYGETENGGSCTSNGGSGTVFELSPPTVTGGAWTETILHSFQLSCGQSDGGAPYGGLIFGPAGVLIGTTFWGGSTASSYGTVFQLSPPTAGNSQWNEKIIYNFTVSSAGSPAGYHPLGGVIIDNKNNLYATAAYGGNGCPTGCGTVIEMSPPAIPGGPWSETTLYSFTGGNDGATPSAPLIFDKKGDLYGTATEGGIGTCADGQVVGGCGAVFELSPPSATGGAWTETTLHTFSGASSDEGLPDSSLIFNQAGTLFGSTAGNNSSKGLYGTVYKIVR